MPELIMLIGISGCGKTTFSSTIEALLVSSDSIREELYGDEAIQNDPSKVFQIAHERVINALKENKNVVFDATNVTTFARKSLLDLLTEVPCKKTGVLFLTTPEVAIQRQKMRTRQVPENVIYRQYATLMREINDIPSQFDDIVIA
jgi:predicted kinase